MYSWQHTAFNAIPMLTYRLPASHLVRMTLQCPATSQRREQPAQVLLQQRRALAMRWRRHRIAGHYALCCADRIPETVL